jgi:hypothetical protein
VLEVLMCWRGAVLEVAVQSVARTLCRDHMRARLSVAAYKFLGLCQGQAVHNLLATSPFFMRHFVCLGPVK